MACDKKGNNNPEVEVPPSGQHARHPNVGDANRGFSYRPVNNKVAGNANTHKRGRQG